MTARQSAQTYSAETLAGIAAKTFGRKVSGRDIRGIVRSGGVVKRLDSRPKGGGNRAHAYTLAEARAILTVLADRQAARTGQTVRLPAPFGAAQRVKAQRAPRARVTAAEATAAVEASDDQS